MPKHIGALRFSTCTDTVIDAIWVQNIKYKMVNGVRLSSGDIRRSPDQKGTPEMEKTGKPIKPKQKPDNNKQSFDIFTFDLKIPFKETWNTSRYKEGTKREMKTKKKDYYFERFLMNTTHLFP